SAVAQEKAPEGDGRDDCAHLQEGAGGRAQGIPDVLADLPVHVRVLSDGPAHSGQRRLRSRDRCEKDSVKALVTGAGGFIGSHFVPYLAARGWSVRAIDVHEAPPGVAGHDVQYRVMDICDVRQLAAAVEGVDYVLTLPAFTWTCTRASRNSRPSMSRRWRDWWSCAASAVCAGSCRSAAWVCMDTFSLPLRTRPRR